jgi:galactofuranosylgalactofuranosylrhamnosyl-N-acetylglucosaminyl-diphospho-decaprenol beta-1,5/1,6-galactofuranosyltransferase
MRLQTIEHPNQICGIPELYYHEGSHRTVDYDGYFNLFYIEKHKKYTRIKNLALELTLAGYSELTLMHDRESIVTYTLNPNVRRQYRFEFPYQQYDQGVFWFRLEKSLQDFETTEADAENLTESCVAGGYSSDLTDPWQINIAVDICTYRREQDALTGLQRIAEIMDQKLDVSKHLYTFLIDNGKTLEGHPEITKITEKYTNRIQVIANKNTGGAGGFTRGMIEAIRKQDELGLTHILLMDDDAKFDPDLFVRLYGFLSVLKPEYRDIRVGGGLFREDFPFAMNSCGEWSENFDIINPQRLKDMRQYVNCVNPFMTGTQDEKQMYSGWWCCCYSLNVVRSNNLPLPVFIHDDDIEYEIRNKNYGIVFLNGINVWHPGFDFSMYGVNQYYDIRNKLITATLHEETKSDAVIIKRVVKRMAALLFQFRYTEMEFVYWALKDFCKGPEWLYKVNAEKLNTNLRAIMNKRAKLWPLNELKLNNTEEDAVAKLIHQYGFEKLKEGYDRQEDRKPCRVFSINGWLLPADKRTEVITVLHSPFDTFRASDVVLIDPNTKQGIKNHKQYSKLLLFIGMSLKVMILVTQRYRKAAKLYRENLNQISCQSTWIRYLDQD